MSSMSAVVVFFVFFNQRPAYGVRSSDWGSDVCSSCLLCVADSPRLSAAGMAGIRDTVERNRSRLPDVSRREMLIGATAAGGLAIAWSLWPRDYQPTLTAAPDEHVFNAFLKNGDDGHNNGRPPSREREGQYV